MINVLEAPELRSHPSIAEKMRLVEYLIDPLKQIRAAMDHFQGRPVPRGVPLSKLKEPHPNQWEDGSGKVWVVVSGQGVGGILVRREEGLDSQLLGRLAPNSLVEELERTDTRLKYHLMEDLAELRGINPGKGPEVGWVSIVSNQRPLLVPLYFDLDPEDPVLKEDWQVSRGRVQQFTAPTPHAKEVGVLRGGDEVSGVPITRNDVQWLRTRNSNGEICYMRTEDLTRAEDVKLAKARPLPISWMPTEDLQRAKMQLRSRSRSPSPLPKWLEDAPSSRSRARSAPPRAGSAPPSRTPERRVIGYSSMLGYLFEPEVRA